MSSNDQADGFFDDGGAWAKCNHPGCIGAKECMTPLKPNENSGKGRGARRYATEMDCVERAHMPMGYRLSHGFAILKGGDI